MMAEQKKGQIQIFAKNITGVSHGKILEESKYTRNIAGENMFKMEEMALKTELIQQEI